MLKGKSRANECYECKGQLELFELDMRNKTRILKCKDCGLYHFYKKDMLANWRLTKVSRELHSDSGG